jgi:putative peptidoglycan lipid II flippase
MLDGQGCSRIRKDVGRTATRIGFIIIGETVGNEGQQAPVPPQGGAGQQQPYYGWQYDQDATAQAPAGPPPGMYPPPQAPAQYPSQVQGQAGQQPPLPAHYQQPLPDMGTSLGYAQSMQYQYTDVPQPSQPIPQLRQARLQQLREERMRRQQRRMRPDITTVVERKGKTGKRSPDGTPPIQQPQQAMEPPQLSPGWGAGAPPSMMAGSPAAPPLPPTQMSPVLPLPPTEISPTDVGSLQGSPVEFRAGAGPMVESVAIASQDTGMIQRANIGRAALIISSAFVASRVLGLLRSSMFAFVFGTSSTSDAYLQAFFVPDLIFNLVAGGALSSAFIPVFTKYWVGDRDEKTAWHLASSALNLTITVMIVLAALAIIFARQFVPLYNPGEPPAQLDLITSLIRIMLLQSIALGIGVITSSVLQSRQNFLLPAVGTVLYNVGLIAGLIPGIILAAHRTANYNSVAVYAATWGVVAGAVLQVGIQIPGLVKVGMHYTFSFDWRHPGVIQVARQMGPRIFNAAMLFLSTLVDRSLILLLAVVVTEAFVQGLITQYYQAFQLVLLPLGIFGMSIATAVFPSLAECVTRGRLDRFRELILETLRSILFLTVPSSMGFIVLGLPIIQVLLQHGAFSLQDAQSTSVPLAFFAVGLTGLSAVEILTRSFYALRDSATPVIVSIGQFIFKIALSLVLINLAVLGSTLPMKGALGMGMLAFSTSCAGLIEAAILFWLLHQRIGQMQVRATALFLGRVLLASVAMGIVLLILRLMLDTVLVTTAPNQLLGFGGTMIAFIKLLIEIVAGVLTYFLTARLLGIGIDTLNLGPVRRLLDRLKLSWL